MKLLLAACLAACLYASLVVAKAGPRNMGSQYVTLSFCRRCSFRLFQSMGTEVEGGHRPSLI